MLPPDGGTPIAFATSWCTVADACGALIVAVKTTVSPGFRLSTFSGVMPLTGASDSVTMRSTTRTSLSTWSPVLVTS
ncbi:hypothetical protein CXF29_05550 [Corynebacterium bovis]|nr:hypothetical protein CXF36_03270 [Corynebacterium bovis]RRO95149.1 hypothetical protein CXF29_05550 [Corynebacterium bovis]